MAFLASDEVGFITGSLRLVDGGAHATRYPDILARIAELGTDPVSPLVPPPWTGR